MASIKAKIANLQDTKDGKLKVTVNYWLVDHPHIGAEQQIYSTPHTVDVATKLATKLGEAKTVAEAVAEIKQEFVTEEIQPTAQSAYTNFNNVNVLADFSTELGKEIIVTVS